MHVGKKIARHVGHDYIKTRQGRVAHVLEQDRQGGNIGGVAKIFLYRSQYRVEAGSYALKRWRGLLAAHRHYFTGHALAPEAGITNRAEIAIVAGAGDR